MKKWISVADGLEHQLTVDELKILQWKVEGNKIDTGYVLQNIEEL